MPEKADSGKKRTKTYRPPGKLSATDKAALEAAPRVTVERIAPGGPVRVNTQLFGSLVNLLAYERVEDVPTPLAERCCLPCPPPKGKRELRPGKPVVHWKIVEEAK